MQVNVLDNNVDIDSHFFKLAYSVYYAAQKCMLYITSAAFYSLAHYAPWCVPFRRQAGHHQPTKNA